MHKLIKNAGTIFLIGIFCLVIYKNLFGSGIPATHDGPIHMVRMVSYYLALIQDQIPPRIGPNLANGLGYPVFNYNYPLSNILAAVLMKLHFSYAFIFQLITFFWIWTGSVSTFYLLSRLNFNSSSKALGVILYVANPFLITQVFVRGGIGELAYIGLLPWVAYAIIHLLDSRSCFLRRQLLLAFFASAISLSHNVLFVFGIPFFASFSLWKCREDLSRLYRLILPSMLVALISGFFWLPALFEKSLTVLDSLPITNQFSQHFLYPHQFFINKIGYGFSRPGPVDGMFFGLNISEIIMIIMIISTITFWWRDLKIKLMFFGTLILAILCLDFSSFVWNKIPFSNYIQFPWRILWFFHFLLLLLSIEWIRLMKLSRLMIAAMALLAVVGIGGLNRPQYRVSRTSEERLRSGETTSTMNENLPKSANLNLAYEVADKSFKDKLVLISSPGAVVDINFWNGSNREYSIESTESAIVSEKSFYFPGWETRIDNILVENDLRDEWGSGLITYKASPGLHKIQSRFTQNTWSRRAGNIASVLGLGIFLILLMKVIFYERK